MFLFTFQLDCSLIAGEPRGSRLLEQSCWQSCVNTWSSDCTSGHLFARVFASLRILWLSIRLSCCGWPCTASIHRRASTHTHEDPRGHADSSAKASRPLAGPSAQALLITFPFTPNAMRLLSELQNNRVALNCTATEHASSPASSAII